MRRTISRLLLGILSYLWLTPLWAATLVISPMRFDFSDKQDMAVFTIKNQEDAPIIMQASIKQWSKKGDEDIYKRTTDFVMAPQVFKIPGKTSQIIRILLRMPPDPILQRGYRLFLEEVVPTKPLFNQTAALLFSMHLVLPLFVQPKTTSTPKPIWQSHWQDPSHLQITLQNAGYTIMDISQLQLYTHTGTTASPLQQGFIYVFPNQSHQWILATKKTNEPLTAHVSIDRQPTVVAITPT